MSCSCSEKAITTRNFPVKLHAVPIFEFSWLGVLSSNEKCQVSYGKTVHLGIKDLCFVPLPLWSLGENSKFPFSKCPKLCKVWMSSIIGQHKYPQNAVSNPILSLSLHPQSKLLFWSPWFLFQEICNKELLVRKKWFKSGAFQNTRLHNHVSTVGTHLIIIQYTQHIHCVKTFYNINDIAERLPTAKPAEVA